MTGIAISKLEHGVIRVFAISRPMSEMARALKQRTKTELASELLGTPVEDQDIELFPLSDLVGIGLARYLTDGYDVDGPDLRADRARLEALDGYVLLLFSSVSSTNDIALAPSPDLTLIGTYSEPQADYRAAPIKTPSADPYSGVSQTPKVPSRVRVGSALTAIGVILFLLIIWWIL